MSLIENMGKHIVVIKDSILEDILQFLDSCQSNSSLFVCGVLKAY